MKKICFFIIGVFLLSFSFAQNTETKTRTIPAIDIQTIDGEAFNTSKISNDGKPIIISFWATWCKPCVKELTSIAEVYEDWQKETGVKLIAVSIDDARTSASVKPFVLGKGWNYDVLLDINGNFKRALNVNLVPSTFLVNGKGEIVWSHTSFAEGGELELIKLVKKVIAGEPITE
jgi:cytochrome c biogenesis protein CcmG, thiol:disulfide interchange protein DsbE